jgi:hypothetical protein
MQGLDREVDRGVPLVGRASARVKNICESHTQRWDFCWCCRRMVGPRKQPQPNTRLAQRHPVTAAAGWRAGQQLRDDSFAHRRPCRHTVMIPIVAHTRLQSLPLPLSSFRTICDNKFKKKLRLSANRRESASTDLLVKHPEQTILLHSPTHWEASPTLAQPHTTLPARDDPFVYSSCASSTAPMLFA